MSRHFRFVEDAKVHRQSAVREGTIAVTANHGFPIDDLTSVVFKFSELMPGQRKQPIPEFSLDADAIEGMVEYLFSHLDADARKRVIEKLAPGMMQEAETVIDLAKDEQYLGGQALAFMVTGLVES